MLLSCKKNSYRCSRQQIWKNANIRPNKLSHVWRQLSTDSQNFQSMQVHVSNTTGCPQSLGTQGFSLEIDRHGFVEADTDVSAIHGPIADISKFFKSCFLLHYQNMMYFMPYLFSKTSKIRTYELKFFKLQLFQYLISLTCWHFVHCMQWTNAVPQKKSKNNKTIRTEHWMKELLTSLTTKKAKTVLESWKMVNNEKEVQNDVSS